jgi:hypothetical protein
LNHTHGLVGTPAKRLNPNSTPRTATMNSVTALMTSYNIANPNSTPRKANHSCTQQTKHRTDRSNSFKLVHWKRANGTAPSNMLSYRNSLDNALHCLNVHGISPANLLVDLQCRSIVHVCDVTGERQSSWSVDLQCCGMMCVTSPVSDRVHGQ